MNGNPGIDCVFQSCPGPDFGLKLKRVGIHASIYIIYITVSTHFIGSGAFIHITHIGR